MDSLDPVNQAVFPSHLSSVLLRYCSPLPPAWVSASLSPDTDTRSRRLRRLVTCGGDIVFCLSVTIFVSDHCLSWFSLCDTLMLGHLCSLQRLVPGPVSWSGYLAHNCPLRLAPSPQYHRLHLRGNCFLFVTKSKSIYQILI